MPSIKIFSSSLFFTNAHKIPRKLKVTKFTVLNNHQKGLVLKMNHYQTINIPLLKTCSLILVALLLQMENAHCQFALCGPSRTSFLTSRHPEDMHVVANRNLNWRQNWQTKDVYSMPQYFKEHDYRTKSIGKIFHHFARKSGTPDDYPHSWTDLPFIVDQSV